MIECLLFWVLGISIVCAYFVFLNLSLIEIFLSIMPFIFLFLFFLFFRAQFFSPVGITVFQATNSHKKFVSFLLKDYNALSIEIKQVKDFTSDVLTLEEIQAIPQWLLTILRELHEKETLSMSIVKVRRLSFRKNGDGNQSQIPTSYSAYRMPHRTQIDAPIQQRFVFLHLPNAPGIPIEAVIQATISTRERLRGGETIDRELEKKAIRSTLLKTLQSGNEIIRELQGEQLVASLSIQDPLNILKKLRSVSNGRDKVIANRLAMALGLGLLYSSFDEKDNGNGNVDVGEGSEGDGNGDGGNGNGNGGGD
ncbi:MAG: hypothetical protein NZM37_06270 [Sandaracinaceae bacterium]|nr:hypothetical protein [Sandaracinaceae bacterium]